MVYTCKYKSSIGDILLATDEIGLIGLWFEGQKYFANTLPDEHIPLIVTKDMSERKNKMIELGDAFIAFPGGTGTLEEITEVMSKVSLKQLDAPCILYNLNGYYNSLKELLNHMIEKGLSDQERQKGIFFADDLMQIQEKLSFVKADGEK